MVQPERRDPPVKPKAPPGLSRLLAWGTWAMFAALIAVSAQQTRFSLDTLFQGVPDFVRFFGRLWPPEWRALPEIWEPIIETIQMAYLGTVLGVALGTPLIFLASRTTTPWVPLMWVVRAFLTVVRSIPELLYAAVLVGVLAFGPLPGVAALTIFTMAVLAKLASETVEAIDPGPLEALRSTGATGTQVIVYGVVPQVAATLVSFILYIFEINVRASTVLGYVGAGGIGLLLRTYLAFFDYQALALLIIAVFIVVLAIDTVSSYIRSRLI